MRWVLRHSVHYSDLSRTRKTWYLARWQLEIDDLCHSTAGVCVRACLWLAVVGFRHFLRFQVYNRAHSANVQDIRSEVAVLVYKVLHGCAPSYLGLFTYVADLPSRRGLLRSSCSDCLVQPTVHRSTVGSRAFSVAGPQVWNCLPPEVTSASSLTTFRTRLKTFLFTESFPDIRHIWHLIYSTHCL